MDIEAKEKQLINQQDNDDVKIQTKAKIFCFHLKEYFFKKKQNFAWSEEKPSRKFERLKDLASKKLMKLLSQHHTQKMKLENSFDKN